MTSKSNTCCELIEGFKQFSNIRYVAYRTAAKVKFIQEETKLNFVKLQHVFQELEKLGFGSGDRELTLNRSEALRISGGIFHQAQVMVLTDLNKKASSSLVTDLFEKTYCRNNENSTLFDLVVFLTVLCGGFDISEKYKKLLYFICNDSNLISRKSLRLFLKSIAKIAHLVQEASAFGQWTVCNAVEQCFGKFEGRLNEIPLNAALEWFLCQPQSLVWWTTLSRLTASSKVIHSVRCSVCNSPQIQGLRYQCLKCLCYNQCQQCFWSGLISKNHKIHHQMQEYCSKTTSKEATRALWKKMSNWLALKKKGIRSAQYLPFEKAEKISDFASLSNEHLNSFNTLSCDTVNAGDLRGSDQESVTNVVRDLMEEKARLENILRNAHSTNSLCPVVEEHCKRLELQLRRLCNNNPHQPRPKSIFPRLPKLLNRLESTPLLSKDQRNVTLEALSYSPIDEPQSIIMRAQPQRLSLRMPQKTESIVSSSFYTPRMTKRSKSPVDSFLNEPPRFMTDFTLKDLSRDLRQLPEHPAMAPLINDTSDSQLNEELEAILIQLDQLFPGSPTAKLCDTAAPIVGTTDNPNLTLVKASNQVAGALAEFLDGFKE